MDGRFFYSRCFAVNTIAFRVNTAWWLRLYLYGIVIVNHFTGMSPNMDRVAYWIEKGLSVEVVK